MKIIIDTLKPYHITIDTASIDEMPIIQNLARFYAYDMSKFCGHNPNWEFPENGLYEAMDFSHYWEMGRTALIIHINDELGGFALINKSGSTEDVNYDLGEFFIVGKFQGKGIGREVAIQIFKNFPGVWEVRQMPDNAPAITFWAKIISEFTQGNYTKAVKTFYGPEPYVNIVLKFGAIP